MGGIKSLLMRFNPLIMRYNLLLLAFWAYTTLTAQEKSRISLFEKLSQEDSITLTLSYPFDSLIKSNNRDIEALISISTKNGMLLDEQPLSLTIRGKYRRMKCSFPPLLLNFKKSMLKTLDLANVDEIKLVTHCVDGPEGIQNLQEERMLYQVYETVTPRSYKTIWVNVFYCDIDHPEIRDTSSGFLIEPDPDVASRLGVCEKKMFNLNEDSLQYESYANTAAFNFMIGNRDWSIIGARNAKLFYDTAMRKYIAIPYDFDFSNVVGASYRREKLSEGMIHPYDRIYKGEYFTAKAGEMLKTFYVFRDTILNTVRTAPNPLSEERRKQIGKYFEKWFEMIRKNKPGDLPYDCICPYNGGL